MTIQERLKHIMEYLAAQEKKYNRKITLIAVTKTFDVSTIRDAYHAGLRHFGENRIQEALPKIEALSDLPDITWHFIGHLQSNKAKHAAAHFSMIQSVDRYSAAAAINKYADRAGIIMPILIEINTSGEASKNGILPADASDFYSRLTELKNLHIRGVMTVGPLTRDEDKQRESFRLLMQCRSSIASEFPDARLDIISMGMSDDYTVAIEEGSTMIRLGRALFGQR